MENFDPPKPPEVNGVLKTGGLYAFIPLSYMDFAAKEGMIEPEPNEPGVFRYTKDFPWTQKLNNHL